MLGVFLPRDGGKTIRVMVEIGFMIEVEAAVIMMTELGIASTLKLLAMLVPTV